jgi:hypothetical protein
VNISINITVPLGNQGAASTAADARADAHTVAQPEGQPVATFVISEVSANARMITGNNAVQKPILDIYPGPKADITERIKFMQGAKVQVLALPVTADGNEKYYQIADIRGKKGEILYLRAKDGSVL